MKERWNTARQEQSFYETYTGEKKSSREFFANVNPFTEKIVTYEVSYQLNYSSQRDAMKITNANTFYVYAFEPTPQSGETIIQNTKDAVINASSSQGNGFQLGTQAMIEKNMQVKLDKPRGLEISNKPPTKEVIESVTKGKGFYVEQRDTEFEVSNKKGSKFKMKGNLGDYFSAT